MVISFAAINALRVAATVIHVIALISTTYRVSYRIRTKRFWWDDGWVLLAFIADILTVISMWISAYLNNNFKKIPPEVFREQRVVASWLMSISFTCTIWFTRIGLVCTFLPLLTNGRVKKLSVLCATFFVLCCLSIVLWKVVVCTKDTSWLSEPFGFCEVGRANGIWDVIAEVTSCVALILIGAYVLWQMNLQSKERKIVMLVFSGSIFTAMAALARSYSTIATDDLLKTFTGHFEAAISLIVCNVLVVMTSIYNGLERRREPIPIASTATSKNQQRATTPERLDQFSMSNIESGGRSRTSTVMTFTDVNSRPSDSIDRDVRSQQSISPMHSVSDQSRRGQTSISIRDEFIYLTDSEPCSGSVIIILDPSDNDHESDTCSSV
ncbi:hypothetical protein VKT23_003456 [Stygiomarasmius scandens]|uniref:Rhodopsin domain-containing protein n=1 Tax=Marasmiellus scandens TaxID=2682957 RepID=A0ABR1JX95_9AGAR